MICHIGFKWSSIIFHKQKEQTAKYQHQGIAILNTVWEFGNIYRTNQYKLHPSRQIKKYFTL